MYSNEESADQMSFSSSSCSSRDPKCLSKKDIPKLHRVRRTSLRQLVSVSLLLVVTSSLFTYTLAGPSSPRNSAVKQFCAASSASSEKMSSSESNYSPLFSSIISQCSNTIDKARHLAEKWFSTELGQENYEYYIVKMKGALVEGIPKTIHTPTEAKVLENLDEKSTLDKLFRDLALVRNAVLERVRVANKKYESDRDIFSELHVEIIQVIEELRHVLNSFEIEIPSETTNPDNPDRVRHENSEDATDRKRKNWLIFYDYIVLVEYTHDIMKYLDKKHCSSV